MWRSLVARLNGVQEAGSSNLLTQTRSSRTVERPRRFFIRFAHQNPRIDARRPLLPFRAMSASLLHFAAAKYPPVPARLPHSAGALRALTIHETEERPRRFFIRFAHQNPRPDAHRPLLPFRVMSASLLQLCRYEHTPFPARLPHSAGALRALTIHETEERPRRFFIRFAHQNPRPDAHRPLLPFRVSRGKTLDTLCGTV